MNHDYDDQLKRPELQREAEAPRPAPAAAPSTRQQAAPYYTPPPGCGRTPPPPRRPWRLVGLGVVAAFALGAGAWYAMQPAREPVPPPPAAQADVTQTLLISDSDADSAATAYLQKLLAGGAPALATAASGGQDQPEPLAAANAPALKQLAEDSPVMAQELESGRRTLYRLHLLDHLAEDGDEVEVSVDGVSQGPVPLSNVGTDMLIPLTQGKPAQIKVTATRDGGGGVTFGAVSSLGEARTRVMQVGESEQWQVTVK